MPLNETPTPAGDQLAGSAAGTGDEGKADKSIHIPADALPPGIKEGDTLKCVAMDENGCSFQLTSSTAKDEGESWEKDFRKEMSPQNSKEEAM